MQSLTQKDVTNSFINASRKEVSQLPVPESLEDQKWDEIDFLGWADPKNPSRSFVVGIIDGKPRGVILRAVPSRQPTSMCSWCEDIKNTTDVRMFSAKRAGAAGRQGNTVGTLLHSDFSCSANVRRAPSALEGSSADAEAFAERRIAALHAKVSGFLGAVIGS